MRLAPPAADLVPKDQRNGAACDGDGTGLRTGAATDCSGGTEIILSRICRSAACSLVVKSRVICSWAAASWSTLWRTAARSSEIALSSCESGEVAGGTIVSGTVCAMADCGANQPSCGGEFAMISLAASP